MKRRKIPCSVVLQVFEEQIVKYFKLQRKWLREALTILTSSGKPMASCVIQYVLRKAPNIWKIIRQRI